MKNSREFIEQYNKTIDNNRKIANALYYLEKHQQEASGYNYSSKAVYYNEKNEDIIL